jgi:hypothetical protein
MPAIRLRALSSLYINRWGARHQHAGDAAAGHRRPAIPPEKPAFPRYLGIPRV